MASLLTKEEKKMADLAAKKARMQAKLVAKARMQGKLVAKEAAKKAAKKARMRAKLVAKEAKEVAKEARMRAKEARMVERLIEKKQRRDAIILFRQQARDEKMVLKEQERAAKIEAKNVAKIELKNNAINRMRRVKDEMPPEFSVNQFCEKYIQLFGRINPYKGTPILEGDKYDVYAGIRGLLYELSPSSTQHWFQYGKKKSGEEIGPWFFANKELALVNNAYEWNTSTTAQKSAQRRHRGMWTSLPPDSRATYDANLFGPIPDEATLEQASVGRKIGRRGSGGIRNDTNVIVSEV
uniref:Uncharacterized protein n=1 Tax=viral metagenome TaxID=1070528 RepID=A0A6C0D994_9ZZZZ